MGNNSVPVVLTIASSDSGGCAGVQADIRTCASLNTFCTTAIVSLTSQNTLGVTHVNPTSLESVTTQIDAVMSDIGAKAVKSGMLFSADIIKVVSDGIKKWNIPNYVLDPVMVASSGAVLLQENAIQNVIEMLLPLAAVITPNIPEAQVLSGIRIRNRQDMHTACKIMHDKGAQTVLLKSGHGADNGADISIGSDLWFDGGAFHDFYQPYVESKNLHGTGCTFSAAIASYLAQGLSMYDSIEKAKLYIYNAILYGKDTKIGAGSGPVDHFWSRRVD